MKKVSIILLLLITSLKLSAQWSDVVINFDKYEHNFGTHTWQIAHYDNQWLYFANNLGMIEYNANRWQNLSDESGAEFRSVMPSERTNRIYTGGITEFGYFEPAPNGEMIYTCLSDSLGLNLQGSHHQNFWNIMEYENTLYFQSDNSIVKIVDNQLFTVDVGSKIFASTIIDGVLYLGTQRGLFMLAGNGVLKIANSECLDDKVIRKILSYNGTMLLVTSRGGLYEYDGNRVMPFKFANSEVVKGKSIFSATIWGDNLALGSVSDGIYLFNLKGGSVRHFSRDNGLQSNTVLSIAYADNKLWVGLDGGIDCILLNLPLVDFDYNRSLGAGYDALLDGDYLYLATNAGLHYLQQTSRELKSFGNANGQAWRIVRLAGDVLSLQDAGLFQIEGNRAVRIGDIRGVWSCVPHPSDVNKAIIGSYDALYVISKEGARWAIKQKIEGFSGAPYSIKFISNNELYIYDLENEAVILLDDDFKRALSYTELESGEGLHLNSVKLKGVDISAHNNYISIVGADTTTFINLPNQFRITKLSNGATELNDSLVAITHENGFSALNTNKVWMKAAYKERIVVHEVYDISFGDSLLYRRNFARKRGDISLHHTHNSLRFVVAMSSLEHTHYNRYQYRLSKGDDEALWSDMSALNVKEYNDLEYGEYTFSVRVTPSEGVVYSDSISFTIQTPWYHTQLAYALYLLMLLSMIALCYYALNSYYKRRSLKLVAQRMRLQQESFEREREQHQAQVLELEREQIEHTLRHKSIEVANLMINSENKRRLFDEIRDELATLRRGIVADKKEQSLSLLDSINSQIESNITGEETLKRIEQEFDIAHDNFMKRLVAQHPNLNYNERMMCAYLKVGLSTKEIAPLLNISIRGVETLRYRIRKKFDLGREDSLRGYLSGNNSPL